MWFFSKVKSIEEIVFLSVKILFLFYTLICILHKTVFQFFTRNMNPIFNRTYGNIEPISYLMIFETTIVQHKRSTVSIFKTFNRFIDVGKRKLAVGKVVCCIFRRIDEVLGFCKVDKSTTPQYTLIVCNKRVFHNRVQPCF